MEPAAVLRDGILDIQFAILVVKGNSLFNLQAAQQSKEEDIIVIILDVMGHRFGELSFWLTITK